ncbi:MAG: nucleotidyltransferase domain-containing protein [Caldilineaceae bacterium]
MSQNEILETLSHFQKSKRDEYHIRRIGIFGSAARNQLSDTSDVDVVVELGEPDLLILVGIKQDLKSY